jgi:hypothetical protein
MQPVDWHGVDPSGLFAVIREQATAPDAERMVWALEHALAGARVDPALLDHLAAAAVCALAYRDGDTPRGVLEQLFRRAVPDGRWRDDYASLLTPDP